MLFDDFWLWVLWVVKDLVDYVLNFLREIEIERKMCEIRCSWMKMGDFWMMEMVLKSENCCLRFDLGLFEDDGCKNDA